MPPSCRASDDADTIVALAGADVRVQHLLAQRPRRAVAEVEGERPEGEQDDRPGDRHERESSCCDDHQGCGGSPRRPARGAPGAQRESGAQRGSAEAEGDDDAVGLAAVRLAPDQIGEAARVQQLDAHEDRTGAERPAGADDGVRRGEAPAVLRDREQHQARQAEHTGQQQDGTAAERVGQAVLCEVVAHEWRRGADGRAMTQTSVRPPQSSSVAERLCAARQHAGLSLDEAATTTGLLRSYVAALEAGRRRPLPREVDRLARAYGADLSDLLPARRPVEVDEGRITVAGQSRQLRAAADEREVYAAYLFLLYAVRGAEPGQRIPLRSSDVELLMQVVGEDASTIEHRLVQLMGCSPDEASRLGSVLLRHRALTAAVGAAAALTWVAVVAPGVPADVPRPAHVSATPLSGSTSSAAYFDADAADEQDALPVDGVVDGSVDGEWSPSYPVGADG